MTNKQLTKASHHGEVDLNGFKIACAVLEDGTRVFSERSLANAFGIKGSGSFWQKKRNQENESAFLPEYLSAKYLSPFISNELREKFESAFSYLSIYKKEARGVDATILVDICDVFITAKNKGIKNEKFLEIANNAYIMMKAFAKVGIIALVDEATGYQYDREKKELQVILKALVSDEILEYQQQFYPSFYKEIFRLWNIPFTPQNIKRKPQFIGHLTNKYVYSNLPKGIFVLEKLKAKTPRTKGGNYRYQLHRSLTKDAGREALKKVLYSVEALASIAKDKRDFDRLINEKYGQKEIPFGELERLSKESIGEKSNEPLSLFNKSLKTALEFNPEKNKSK